MEISEKVFHHTLIECRQILLAEEVNERLQERISASLLFLNAFADTEITLFIDSTGGDINSELWLMDQIASSNAHVRGVVIGVAKSAAFGILQACHIRQAYPHAELLFHAPSFRIRCDDDVATRIEKTVRVHEEQLTAFAKRSGQSVELWRAWAKEEKLFSAPEALSLGMLDCIVPVDWVPHS
jgi:ATP-dependent Clp protease, protease subunit